MHLPCREPTPVSDTDTGRVLMVKKQLVADDNYKHRQYGVMLGVISHKLVFMQTATHAVFTKASINSGF